MKKSVRNFSVEFFWKQEDTKVLSIYIYIYIYAHKDIRYIYIYAHKDVTFIAFFFCYCYSPSLISSFNHKNNYFILLYSQTSNNGHCRGIQILSVIGGIR
jgi:hypothetical protein